MEQFLTIASETWDKIASAGAYAIQKFVFALSGYEMSQILALIILHGVGAVLIFWLFLKIKQPKKVHYLMEGGHRYYRP